MGVPAVNSLPQCRWLWIANSSATNAMMLRKAKFVQMIKRRVLGISAILLFSSAHSSLAVGFDLGEGPGGSRASSICSQRGHGMGAGGSGGITLRTYPSTR